MLEYDPRKLKYPGDDKFRAYTQQPKSKRRKHRPTGNASVNSDSSYSTTRSGITKVDVEENSDRLCGFLDELILHEQSVQSLKAHRSLKCVSCGKPCYHRCSLCPGGPAMHFYKPSGRSSSCFVHYHNTASFGKWKCDVHLVGRKRKDWTYPDQDELKEHSLDMTRLQLATQSTINARVEPPLPPGNARV